MILTVAAFVQLAATCGPSVHVDTLASIVQAETRFDTLAIHDNTTGRTYHPATLGDAVKVATSLVTVQRHSADLGLMQINSGNLTGLGMSIADAFDACKSIAGGARVLASGYEPPAAGTDAQPALLRALSRYNTGGPQRGFTNGYVQRVQLAAGQVVPAIRLGGTGGDAPEGQGAAPPPPPPPPPSWDVYGQARYQREHGGIVFGGTPPARSVSAPGPASSGTAPAPAAKPVELQTVAGLTSPDR